MVDSREQKPYKFREDDVRKKLDEGDYSIEGLENCICVERKSVGDFVNSVIPGRGWKRFEKELRRMQKYERACIVVEGNLSDLHAGQYVSELHPNSLEGFMNRIIADYNIPVYCVSSHTTGNRFVKTLLLRLATLFHPALLETV